MGVQGSNHLADDGSARTLQDFGDDEFVGVEESADFIHSGHERAVNNFKRPQ